MEGSSLRVAIIRTREIPDSTRRGEMPKLRMPEDRKAICELIEDQLRELASVDLPLAIPKQGDPRLVSHQLGLQGVVEDPSVRMGVNELIGNGKIVVSEPVWVDTQGSLDDSRVQYGRLA